MKDLDYVFQQISIIFGMSEKAERMGDLETCLILEKTSLFSNHYFVEQKK